MDDSEMENNKLSTKILVENLIDMATQKYEKRWHFRRTYLLRYLTEISINLFSDSFDD